MTSFRLLTLAAIVAAPLAGCASLGGDDSPVCDGRHRRPANPHGSTLVPAPAPPPPSGTAPPSGPSGGCA